MPQMTTDRGAQAGEGTYTCALGGRGSSSCPIFNLTGGISLATANITETN